MSEEEKNAVVDAAPASEEQVEESGQAEATQERMVPLAALESERRKRQDLEQKSKLYEEMLMKHSNEKKDAVQDESDDDEFATRKHLKTEKAVAKREILEEMFLDSHPEKMAEINEYLEKIIERKPWLSQSVATAVNRYARAYEIVQDYKHLVVKQQQKSIEAKRIVENAQKPGSPVAVGKTDTKSQADMLLSMRGTTDFAKYRKELLKGAR